MEDQGRQHPAGVEPQPAPEATFDGISLAELRRRRSYKRRAFPSDVLPAFVAEMDFPLAPPVAAAVAGARP